MKIAVIGATGTIGKVLTANARQRGMEVLATSSKGGPDMMALDLLNVAAVDFAAFDRDCTVMVTAAISAPDVCANQQEYAQAVNLSGTSALIDGVLARGARVVFFSSDVVYGDRDGPVDERTPCIPSGPYGEMKFAVEQRFAGHPGFKAVRLSYVLSRDDKFSSYLNQCVANGRTAEVFDTLGRSVVYRGDVVDGALALAQKWADFPESVINFGGPELLTRAALAQQFKESTLPCLQVKLATPPPDFFQNRPASIDMRSPTFARLLGRPRTTVREALLLDQPSNINQEYSYD